MEWSDFVLILAVSTVQYFNPYDVLKVFMSWADAARGATVGVAIIAVALILSWRKLSD